jgi:lipoyl synthase
MGRLTKIPVQIEYGSKSDTESGKKYQNSSGCTAIKNGVSSKLAYAESAKELAKPDWLRIKYQHSEKFNDLDQLVKKHELSTVCEESMCPNKHECWSHGTATVMLMGEVCTRACRFCAVDSGNPKGWLDPKEPEKVADLVQKMGLKYVVLTSVDRDDLLDGGAGHYAKVVREIKRICPDTDVEVLTPDFSGKLQHVALLFDAGFSVFAQNLETVRRLTHPVRDPRAGYQQTLSVLAYVKRQRPKILTKSSLMVGLGETDAEIKEALYDLRQHEVDIVTLGQYLRPTVHHWPLDRYVHPDLFSQYREWGLAMGFREVVSGPMVRSSYRAERVLAGDNVGL